MIGIDNHREINSSVKFEVVCLLFACQNGNSHYSSFSFNVDRIGLVVVVVPHCIVKRTKKKDRGDVFIVDDEHALTHSNFFFLFSFVFFFFFFFFSSFLASCKDELAQNSFI